MPICLNSLSHRELSWPKNQQPPRTVSPASPFICGVALVKKPGTQQVQAAGRRFQQLSNDKLGGGIPRKGVQVSLNDDGGRCFVHRQGHPRIKTASAILSILLSTRPSQEYCWTSILN